MIQSSTELSDGINKKNNVSCSRLFISNKKRETASSQLKQKIAASQVKPVK